MTDLVSADGDVATVIEDELSWVFDESSVECQISEKSHAAWGVVCGISATHRGGSVCVKKDWLLLCTPFARSAKDPKNPAMCYKHSLPEHIVVLPV